MRNPEKPCWAHWLGAPCRDGDRCPTHADCYLCGDHGCLWRVTAEGVWSGDDVWESVPCSQCQVGQQ